MKAFVHGALRSMNDSNAPFNSPNAIVYEKNSVTAHLEYKSYARVCIGYINVNRYYSR